MESDSTRLARLLEVCVEKAVQAQDALRSGASRIELCSDLSVGGMSPSLDLIQSTIEAIDPLVSNEIDILPLQIMVRFSGPGFVYPDSEVAQMERYIHLVHELNREMVKKRQEERKNEQRKERTSYISGFVFGCLQHASQDSSLSNSSSTQPFLSITNTEQVQNGDEMEISSTQVETLIRASRPLMVTFHRAFDEIYDKQKALMELRAAGVERVLTSGGIGSVCSHIDSLRNLISISGSSTLMCPTLRAKQTDLFTTCEKKDEYSEKQKIADIKVATSQIPSNMISNDEPYLRPIIVMPGGGVRLHNAAQLLDLGALELHSSTPFFLPIV